MSDRPAEPATDRIAPQRARTDRQQRIIVLSLLLGCWLWLSRTHLEQVDLPFFQIKQDLHEQVVRNQGPDPYQYKLWFVSRGFELVERRLGLPLPAVFIANTLLSLALLVALHHVWLRSLVPPLTALVGTLAMTALANILFLGYYHHPYEFWGVALFCLLLAGVQRRWPWHRLALLSLITGLVWEKHALVAVVWTIAQWRSGRARLGTLVKGVGLLALSLTLPVAVRLYLGSERALVDGQTTLAVQEWWKVAMAQVPFVLPFLIVLLASWQRVPPLVRLLWLCLPVIVAAYISQSYILYETRSFWIMVPVFTATLVTVLPRARELSSSAPSG